MSGEIPRNPAVVQGCPWRIGRSRNSDCNRRDAPRGPCRGRGAARGRGCLAKGFDGAGDGEALNAPLVPDLPSRVIHLGGP